MKAEALLDAAPAAAAAGEALPDTANEVALVGDGVDAQGVGTLASLAANGLEGAGLVGTERAGSQVVTQSSAALVPDESPRAPGEAGEAAAGDAVQLLESVEQQATAEAAGDAAVTGSSSARDAEGVIERRQDAPPLEDAGFVERQARSAASSDGAFEQAAATAAPDAVVDAAPAPGGSEGADVDMGEDSPHTPALNLDPESPDAEPGAAAEAALGGAVEAASAGGAADAGPAVLGEVGDADGVDRGDSGRESDAAATSEEGEALRDGGDGRTEARRARESLLKRSNSDKQLEQQVSLLESF